MNRPMYVFPVIPLEYVAAGAHLLSMLGAMVLALVGLVFLPKMG